MAGAATGLQRPILVGGTGRSGSTIVGHLLDHHPDLTLTRPMEVRFLAGNDGVADALAVASRRPGSPQAQAAAELAVDRLLHRWFTRAPDVGLHTSMSLEEVERWAHEYLVGFPDDPIQSSRTLTTRIMDRIAERLGATRLVDTTPANARKADRTEPVYPSSTVVVVTRDGRDVAASFVSQSFGPDDVFEALDQWERRMLRTHAAVSGCRSGRVLTIELMDLVVESRQSSLERLCAFVDVPVDDAMVTWFDENVSAAGAHPGRWRRDFDGETCARIDAAYAGICQRLSSAGIDIPR